MALMPELYLELKDKKGKLCNKTFYNFYTMKC